MNNRGDDHLNNFGVVNFDDELFEQKLVELIKEYGVVVIKNVVPKEACDTYVDRIVRDIETLSDFKRTDLSTWTDGNLPPQVRAGMFHGIVCNTPTINELRFNRNIIKIFTAYYSHFKHTRYDPIDMVVSNDGLNVKPGTVGPFDTGADWAHLDQTTDVDAPYKCIQGQIVLSNSSACFRASPKSHLLFEKFLNREKSHPMAPAKSNGFLKFRTEQYFEMQKAVEKIGGSWQIKIPAEKGDFIVWASSVVHSATLQTQPSKYLRPAKSDPWNGWRCVVFICYRPRDEFTEFQLKTKYEGFKKNLVTNHWGTTIFPSGFDRRTKAESFSPKIRQFIADPAKVYTLPEFTPDLTPEQKIMMGDS